ncbi:(d)CMP kinase [Sinanaerobacter chloroacetimidivorans]|jgi:cytidylate kinase|uniref:Cytidylate kinase n=1 Tax=Sinanaerobacter chloroacetimidivorans TaxID=2818044 RepID=A0A8J7W517_9FIRM|nr:(d)CMP kinase [Sinanaerobacter chloroacetimidivorans]MBR0599488.1 (d)CMP kinase [Sinanaerobacter chloroacetimidivorans]
MDKKIRVAIDGPSGAGKSTIAKLVAKKLGIDYIDTGAMYRAIGYKMLQNQIPLHDEEKLLKMLKETDIDFSNGNIVLDDEIINEKIRTPEISDMASKASALPPVREKLVALQKKMGQSKSVVMDGRDIGTNVLTDAEYKFFMTASSAERAKRRWKELSDKGETVSLEQVEADIIQRDLNDSTRKLNPLCMAEDAMEVNTTGMTIEEVAQKILEVMKWQS